MNRDEQHLLDTLLGQLNRSTASLAPDSKDPEAARQIQDALGQNPDAVYLLVQRHLLMEQALNAAQERIRTLEGKTTGSGSFLGGGQSNVYGQPMGNPAPQPTAAAGPVAAPATDTAQARAGGSFLGTAAATATGVLGGALLFEGVEHLMHGGMSGYGGVPTDVTNITENVYNMPPQDIPMDTSAASNSDMGDLGMNDASNAADWDDGNDVFTGDASDFFGGGLFDGGDDWV